MARKHSKRGVVKQPVPRVLVTEEKVERKIVLNPTTGQYEPVKVVIAPAVYKQGKAEGSTTKRGQKNVVPGQSK